MTNQRRSSNEDLNRAIELAPIVEKVHGANHPELTRVRELTEALQSSESAAKSTDLFAELRQVTSNYEIPADACEAFTWTYEALQLADSAQGE